MILEYEIPKYDGDLVEAVRAEGRRGVKLIEAGARAGMVAPDELILQVRALGANLDESSGGGLCGLRVPKARASRTNCGSVAAFQTLPLNLIGAEE